jgi:hypothetical protein
MPEGIHIFSSDIDIIVSYGGGVTEIHRAYKRPAL